MNISSSIDIVAVSILTLQLVITLLKASDMPLSQLQLNRHRFYLIVILLMFAVGVLLHQLTLPILEGNDETLHYNYVLWLRLYKVLPDRTTRTTNMVRQETGQAPLVYWVAATVLDFLNAPLETKDP